MVEEKNCPHCSAQTWDNVKMSRQDWWNLNVMTVGIGDHQRELGRGCRAGVRNTMDLQLAKIYNWFGIQCKASTGYYVTGIEEREVVLAAEWSWLARRDNSSKLQSFNLHWLTAQGTGIRWTVSWWPTNELGWIEHALQSVLCLGCFVL